MVEYYPTRVSKMAKGDNVSGYFYLKTSEIRTSNQNSRYMDMTFCDKTGEINAKMWNAGDGDEILFRAGTIVYAECLVKEFQGSLQLRVDTMRRTYESEETDISELVPSAPEKTEVMFEMISRVAEAIGDADLKKLTLYFLEKYRTELLVYPAAKSFHHSVRSGLLYHVYTMLKGARHYTELYPKLNGDLLFTGVILHDIGKIREMELMDCGLVSGYSVEGQLLGHITLGTGMVEVAAAELKTPREKAVLVEHMILSHHYEPEYGSPKKPAFPEAEILHYLDIVDSRMYDMELALASTKPGAFSEKINSLDKRIVLKTEL
ncbi:MAG: HD domain-containing protein [Clostridia bacterium]|nr:HD domain-containing protein [Clostridia bacterium]